jgi:hypothetical protein
MGFSSFGSRRFLLLSSAFLLLAILPAKAFVPGSRASIPAIMAPKFSRDPLVMSPASLSVPSPGEFATSSTALAAGSDLADGSMTSSLIKLLLETIIVNGVPAVFTILVIGFAAFQFRPRKGKDGDFDEDLLRNKKNPAADLYNDLYQGDESDKPMSPFTFFKKLRPQQSPATINRGIPPLEYITINNLNQKYDSYQFSLTAATQSKAKAAAEYRAKNFDRALRLGLAGASGNGTDLTPFVKTTLLELEKNFLKDGSKLLNKIQTVQAEMTKQAIDEEMEDMGIEPYELDPPAPNATASNGTSALRSTAKTEKERKKELKKSKARNEANFATLTKAQRDLMKLELNFIKDIVMTLGSERASGIRAAFLGDISSRGAGGLLAQMQDRPLSVILQGLVHQDVNGEDATSSVNGSQRKSLYVTRFPGDVQASQVAELREEVTAIVRNAKPGDEALVVLQTGGGTVTGYGLAAAQLLRFKEAGMKLTIAVEQVAASGGYMMCCVADKIVSSPFAVLGSIGVITDIPNVYERLKQEGM